MSYQNSLRYTPQPALDLGFRQSLRRRKSFDLPGGKTLWLAVSKYTLAIFSVTFCISLALSHAVHRAEVSVQNIEAQRHQFHNEQTALEEERDTLMSKNRVLIHAEAKLALVVPGEHQVHKL